MLAVSNREYYIPRKVNEDGWAIRHRNGDVTLSKQFTYTVISEDFYGKGEPERLSFIYNGRSVKPSPRTLRIFGSKYCSWWTAELANNEVDRLVINPPKSE